DDPPSRLAIAGAPDGVAELTQHLDGVSPHCLVVLDDEDASAAMRKTRRSLRRTGRHRAFRLDGARQIKLDRGTVPGPAVYLDVPLRLLDEAVDHAETEPAALADALGREERLEGARGDLLRHSGAGVGHRQHDVLSRLQLVVLRRVGLVEIDIG